MTFNFSQFIILIIIIVVIIIQPNKSQFVSPSSLNLWPFFFWNGTIRFGHHSFLIGRMNSFKDNDDYNQRKVNEICVQFIDWIQQWHCSFKCVIWFDRFWFGLKHFQHTHTGTNRVNVLTAHLFAFSLCITPIQHLINEKPIFFNEVVVDTLIDSYYCTFFHTIYSFSHTHTL